MRQNENKLDVNCSRHSECNSTTSSLELPTSTEGGLAADAYAESEKEENFYILGRKVSPILMLAMRKSILSPLTACLAVGTLYTIFHFYAIYVCGSTLFIGPLETPQTFCHIQW